MTGMVTGGWGFVIAAYSFTGAALVTYLVSLVWRLRAEAREHRVSDEAARLESEQISEGSEAVS